MEKRNCMVRQIGMNETIPFEPAGPLDDFFAAHPEAEDNDTIISLSTPMIHGNGKKYPQT